MLYITRDEVYNAYGETHHGRKHYKPLKGNEIFAVVYFLQIIINLSSPVIYCTAH